ncbi:MAG: hypothetical protein KGO05_03650 [Chloroflexota bacterium]|nr:hypothetical protein [Chloroflexota bacterium]
MQQTPQPPSGNWNDPVALDIAFREYQLLMEGTDKITDRRQTVNTLFVSINALFLTGVGYLLLQFFRGNGFFIFFVAGFLVIALIMSRINRTWLKLSESSRRLVDLRIRYMKKLEEAMRASGYFPSVDVPLIGDEPSVIGGANPYTTRGTYSVEDVLYNPDARRVAFGFSLAEQRVGRTFTFAYWIAFVLAVVYFALVIAQYLFPFHIPYIF